MDANIKVQYSTVYGTLSPPKNRAPPEATILFEHWKSPCIQYNVFV